MSKKTDIGKRQPKPKTRVPADFLLPIASGFLGPFVSAPPLFNADKWICRPCDLILFLRKGQLKTAHCPSCKALMEIEKREARPKNVVDSTCEDVTSKRIEAK